MSEAAMMGEAENPSFEIAQHIDVRGFRRQRHGGRGEGGFAVESGSAETGASQEMGDGFQVVFLPQSASSP